MTHHFWNSVFGKGSGKLRVPCYIVAYGSGGCPSNPENTPLFMLQLLPKFKNADRCKI